MQHLTFWIILFIKNKSTVTSIHQRSRKLSGNYSPGRAATGPETIPRWWPAPGRTWGVPPRRRRPPPSASAAASGSGAPPIGWLARVLAPPGRCSRSRRAGPRRWDRTRRRTWTAAPAWPLGHRKSSLPCCWNTKTGR